MSKKDKKSVTINRAKEYLEKFNLDLAKAINEDIVKFLDNSALQLRGPLLKDPTIQFNVSKDMTKLVAILREEKDVELENTFIEIDLLSDAYPKGSSTKKILDKYKKELKKMK